MRKCTAATTRTQHCVLCSRLLTLCAARMRSRKQRGVQSSAREWFGLERAGVVGVQAPRGADVEEHDCTSQTCGIHRRTVRSVNIVLHLQVFKHPFAA